MELVTAPSKTLQVENYLADEIRSGRIPPGSRLQSIRELAPLLNVGPQVVRLAFDNLEKRNLVCKRGRNGTFVSDRVGQSAYLMITRELSDISMPANYVIPGIERTLEQAGAGMIQCPKEFFRKLTPESLNKIVREKQIRGFFLMDNVFNGDEPELILLKNAGLPVVLPLAGPEERALSPFAAVVTDSRHAFLDGVDALIRLGHRRIATVGSVSCSLRGMKWQDYLGHLAESGCKPELLVQADYKPEEIDRAVESVLGKHPTAFMCFSDFYAIHVLDSLRKRGLRVPEDVSVMGYCGYPGGEFMTPPLSTVDLCYETKGAAAAELMLRASDWHDKKECPSPEVRHKVVLRGSTKEYQEK